MVAAALACVAVLGLIGANVEERLSPTSLTMPGTPAERGEAQLNRYFGESAPFTILLRGPARQLDEQGPGLIRALRRSGGASTLSPWDRGSDPSLRPEPDKALVLVDFHDPIGEAVTDTVPELERIVEGRIREPVEPTLTGYAMLWRGLKEANETAARRGEIVAVPLLIIVLLLVFRSPLAAAIPILFGVATVLSSRGAIALLGHWTDVDPIALPVSSMFGLALGVDYALLLVSRFREELRASGSPAVAAKETRRTAGRTIVMAGSTLFFSLLVSLFVVPGPFFAVLIEVVMLATAISVALAWTVGPAVLALLGESVDRWRIGAPVPPRARWMDWVARGLRRPGLLALAIAIPLLLLAAPLLALNIGASDPSQLPSGSKVREDSELVDREVGPGWGAPFIAVVSTERGSILAPRRFRAISRWEHALDEDPNVHTVLGPSPIVDRISPLRRTGNRLLDGDANDGTLGRLDRLGSRLGDAADGVSNLRAGLATASQGTDLLGNGAERARLGASSLSDGLGEAAAGGGRAAGAIERLADGSRRLAAGGRGARLGAVQIELGLEEVLPNIARNGLGPARSLHDDLARRAQSEPELQADVESAKQLVLRLTKARNQVIRLHKQTARLHEGLTSLAEGSSKLQEGTERLSGAADRLEGGLARLDEGAGALALGLGELHGGVGTLGSRLADGADRSLPLQTGLREASRGVTSESRELEGKVDRIRRLSPGVFDSGYFMLSVLDGGRGGTREDVGESIDLRSGGAAVRMLVIPRGGLNSDGATALYDELQRRAADLSRDAHASVAIAGGNAQLIDYGRKANERFPPLIAVMAMVTLLMLVVFLRAWWLAAIAVLLNLATVAVAFGVLALLSRVPSGLPLGGHDTVEVTGAMAVFCVAFGLSIDYAVFLLVRMRESFDQDADHVRAIEVGLEKTARVITGAAVIMTAVFLAFASSGIAVMTQIGIGLAVAVMLDATVIRLVLLPALMLLVGERVWWLPPPLYRLLSRRRRRTGLREALGRADS